MKVFIILLCRWVGETTVLNLSEIIELKKELDKVYHTDLHYHDVCPKPFFTLEQTDSEIQSCIADFLQKRSYSPQFSDDGLQFTVERGL